MKSRMKILVVFYSRSGNTRKTGQEIAKTLRADADEIMEKEDRGGLLGYMKGGMDALSNKKSELVGGGKDASEYDLVIIGTPVWAARLPPPVRAYADANRGKVKKFAAFCTCGGSGGKQNFKEMERILGLGAQATLEVYEREVKSGAYAEKVAGFCGKL